MPHPRHLCDTCGIYATDTCGVYATPAAPMRHLRHLCDTCDTSARRSALPHHVDAPACSHEDMCVRASIAHLCAKSRVYIYGRFPRPPSGGGLRKTPVIGGNIFLARRQIFCPRPRNIRLRYLSVIGSSLHTNYAFLELYSEKTSPSLRLAKRDQKHPHRPVANCKLRLRFSYPHFDTK